MDVKRDEMISKDLDDDNVALEEWIKDYRDLQKKIDKSDLRDKPAKKYEGNILLFFCAIVGVVISIAAIAILYGSSLLP